MNFKGPVIRSVVARYGDNRLRTGYPLAALGFCILTCSRDGKNC